MGSLRWVIVVALILTSACATGQHGGSTGAGTIERIKATKVIKLGYREAAVPFSFVGAGDKPSGYSVDLCTRVADGLRRDLSIPDLRIEWVKVTADTRMTAVIDGTIDLECGVTTHTLSLQERVDFSSMIFINGASLMTRADNRVETVGEFAGKKIAVIPGTTTERVLREGFAKAGVTPEFVAVKEHSEGFAALTERRVDAYASDRGILLGLALTSFDPKGYAIVNRYLSYEPYALMLRRDPAFRLAVDRQLSRIYSSGAITEIYKQWFDLLGPPSELLIAMYAIHALPE